MIDSTCATTTGKNDRDAFMAWATHFLRPVLRPLGQPRSVVVCDSSTLHHGEAFRALVAAAGAELLYLPAYTPPEYNPIELCFGEIKRALKRNGLGGMAPDLAIIAACAAIPTSMMLSFVARSKLDDGTTRVYEPVVMTPALAAIIVAQDGAA